MSEHYPITRAAEWTQSLFTDLVAAPLRVSVGLGKHSPLEEAARWAGAMGFELAFTDQLPPKVGGVMHNSDDYRLILINKCKDERHQVVSLAHEISHVLLHVGETASGSSLRNEHQADLLAFLMVFRRCNSSQLEDLFRHNPDLADSVFAAVGTGVLSLSLGIFAYFEQRIVGRPVLADVNGVQSTPHSEISLPKYPSPFPWARQAGPLPQWDRRYRQKAMSNPFLTGSRGKIPLQLSLNKRNLLPGFPQFGPRRRARRLTPSGGLSLAGLIRTRR